MRKFGKDRQTDSGSTPVSPIAEESPKQPERGKPEVTTSAPEGNDHELDELLQLARGQSERLTAIERMVRYAANENMTVASSNEELKGAAASAARQLVDLELVIKGILSTVNRREEENQLVLQGLRRHFTEQIAQLEARIDTEVQARVVDRLARKVLPAVDDLDLILSESDRLRQSDSVAPWLEATELVRRKLLQGLAALGLEVLPIVEGKTRFDSNLHEAVPADSPTDEVKQADLPELTVLRVKRSGYLLGGGLYRPSRVVVKQKDRTD